MTGSVFRKIYCNCDILKERVLKLQEVENRYCTLIFMTRDAKLALEGTFEPCENGTNDPAVLRSLSILLMSSAQTCLLSELVKAKAIFLSRRPQQGVERCNGASI